MTTGQLMLLDLVMSTLAAAGWLGAGAMAAARRRWIAMGAAGLALAATAGRLVVVAVLARSGWWFVAEKVAFTVPLLVVGGAVAAVVAFRHRFTGAAPVLALLSAGYAAAAGPGLTLLAGYGRTWPLALITVAVVVGAATVTARALKVSRLRAPAAVSFAAAVVGASLLVLSPPTEDLGGGLAAAGPPVSLADLTGPSTPDSGGVVRRYSLEARQATIVLPSGRTVAAWTFNGQIPGPPLTATVGDLVEVTLHNADIVDGVTVHWHGYDVPAAADGAPGVTQDAVAPGGRFVYRFRADRPGTYWYHTHEASDIGVQRGLYGTFVVRPRSVAAGLDITVPVHTFNASTVVANSDLVETRTVATGTPVRLRLVNTDSVPRVMGVAGAPVTVVAIDGTDLSGPTPLRDTAVRVPAGGRYDLTLAMPDRPVALRVGTGAATSLVLRPPGGGEAPAAAIAGWPVLDPLHYGVPAPQPFDVSSAFDRRFDLVLDRGLAWVGGTPGFAYTVNGRAFPRVATEVVRRGDLVELTVVNRGQDVHPWHLHGHRVLVLERDGEHPRGSPLWLDTFDVRPGEVWRVAFRADNPGVWMNHCHNLAHAAQGMALHLTYAGVTSAFHGAHGG